MFIYTLHFFYKQPVYKQLGGGGGAGGGRRLGSPKIDLRRGMQKFFRMRRDAKKGEWKIFEKEKTALQKNSKIRL